MEFNRDNKELEARYHYIVEARVLDLSMYETPPPRAKFQAGNFVTVRDGGKFSSYHSKRFLPAINKAGEIIGYYNSPGAFTKYTVKFASGEILPIHSNFLIGPFKTMEIAVSYEDPSKEINPNDLEFAKNREPLETWETKIAFEQLAKSILTTEPYNFTWHNEPVVIPPDPTYKTTKTTFELARRDSQNGESYLLTREHRTLDKRLTSISSPDGGYTLKLPPHYTKQEQLFSGYGIFSGSYHRYFVTYIKNLKELKQLDLPENRSRWSLNFEIERSNTMSNDLFLKIVSPYLTKEGEGYKIKVPVDGEFHYNPTYLRSCHVLNHLTIVGDAVVTGKRGTVESFNKSPAVIEGDLKVLADCQNFDDMPAVTGNVSFLDSKTEKAYKEFLGREAFKGSEFESIIDF